MSLSKPNRSAATITSTRVEPAPISGICVTCLDGCEGPCEIGRSALKGREMIYPQPFGKTSSGSEKDYPVDFSYFNIQGTCVGAVGMEANSDKAVFPAADTTTQLGADGSIELDFPVFTGAVGSTDIARINWDEMAVGAAISGVIVIIGENVCGMDPQSEIKGGRVINSPEMDRRINIYKQWYNGKGGLIVQANVEDTRLAVPEYVLDKHGVQIMELKWGQGAKDIGGEVKLKTLERAIQLKEREYIVLPDPTLATSQEAFKLGGISEFERHSRLGMVEEEGFYQEVERLRKLGAKYVTLKTGAYRPADLARALKFSSEAKIDLLTIDGAGGGTGMSPWRMMNSGMPHFQGHRSGRPVCQGGLHGPGHHDRSHGSEDPWQAHGRKDGTGGRRRGGRLRTALRRRRPTQGALRQRFHQAAARGHRHVFLHRPPEAGPAAAHGRRPEVRPQVHRPERSGGPDPGSRGGLRHPLCHGFRSGRGGENFGMIPDARNGLPGP
jgi:glutamate synthase domain-containing protein 2